MTLCLLGMTGELCFSLKQGKNLVGRDDVCDVQIDHRLLSRKHAVIGVSNDQVAIKDLGSTNGTMVNFKRIQNAQPLHVGDAVTFGELTYRVALAGVPLRDTLLGHHRSVEQSYSISDSGGDETALRQSIPLPHGWGVTPSNTFTTAVGPTSAELTAILERATLDLSGAGAGLVILEGGFDLSLIKLAGAGPWVLGRDPECDLIIEQNTISQRHAEIIRDLQGWHIKDLASKNGLKINRQRVPQAQLAHGMRVELGQLRCAFVEAVKARSLA